MASLVFAGPFYQEAELIEITIKDWFFDNEFPPLAPQGYFSGDICYTNDLLFEVKLTLSQTNSMASDKAYKKAIDTRDATTDEDESPSSVFDDNYFMTREVYCGFPTYGPQGDVVDLTGGFAVTFNDDDDPDNYNLIWEIYNEWDFLDNPNKYDDYIFEYFDEDADIFTQDY